MHFSRYSIIAIATAIVLSFAGLIGPVWCAEAAAREQNLVLLNEIEADLSKKPDDLVLQGQHAEMMGRLNRFDEQIAEANRILSKDPKFRDAYLLRAHGEGNLNRNAEAITSLNRAFALSPPTPRLLLLKAMYLKNEKRFDEAIGILNQVIQAEPSNYIAYDYRSLCFYRLKGPCENALQDMKKVVLLNPRDLGAKTLLANLRRDVRRKALTPSSFTK
jgi:tetratricopeptide (TPR) repeat protein